MDGVDLLTLGLQEVRGRIAAIPQVCTPRLLTLPTCPERSDTLVKLSTCLLVRGPQLCVVCNTSGGSLLVQNADLACQ
jgi:hypothetical protein